MAVPSQAFSSEADARSRQENASKQESLESVPTGTAPQAGAGLKEAADFPLSRLVWPAILAY
jgi:hypothetical protein